MKRSQQLELVLEEMEALSPQLCQEVLDFIRFLKTQAAQKNIEMALLSEPSLQKDWLRPEEDEAWRDL